MVKSTLAAVVFLLIHTPSYAQRFTERGMTFNPLGTTNGRTGTDGWNWMHTSGGWGGFGAYRLLRDYEHAWSQKLGAFVELVRVDDRSSVAFVSHIEFIANPHNDIGFNPRALFWEEGLLFTQRMGASSWQAGYFHRCKHDMDNLSLGVERSLIFGSFLGKLLIPVVPESRIIDGLIAFRLDIYTIRQDNRMPAGLDRRGVNTKQIISTAGGAFHARKSLPETGIGFYANLWGALNMYADEERLFARLDRTKSIGVDGGFSCGFAIEGTAHFRIGLNYEYLSDTGINPTPEHAHLLSLGVTIINPSVMW